MSECLFADPGCGFAECPFAMDSPPRDICKTEVSRNWPGSSWICSRCGASNAPHVDQCPSCGVWTQDVTDQGDLKIGGTI
jgi:hypothetical protein